MASVGTGTASRCIEGNGPKEKAVFLSSTFRDSFDGESKDVPLRKRIIEEKRGLPVWLWAYEHYWPKDSETPGPDADTIIDRCFSGIRSCDLFVFLLTGRHGSGVTYFPDPTWASYLEMELFAAAMLGKPVLILHLRGHEPSPALADTLRLLSESFSSTEYLIDDEDGLHKRFQEACAALANGTWKSQQSTILAELPEWLSFRRTKQALVEDVNFPALNFLGGRLRSTKQTADPDRARRLLDEVISGNRMMAAGLQSMTHGAALFRLWAVMAELMDASGESVRDPQNAPLWDQVLGLWAGKASWFGLHGHLLMGPLAAVNSQTEFRAKMAVSGTLSSIIETREPLGARASAIYSIAQRMTSRSRKIFHYREASLLATQAIAKDVNARQGVLSIRAHCSMQMALLGHAWELVGATKDLRESLSLREKAGASQSSIGEAMADLGFCLVLGLRPFAGLPMLKEGITLMRNDQTPNGRAFLARGLRKLERAATLVNARKTADESRRERMKIAGEIDAPDQARNI